MSDITEQHGLEQCIEVMKKVKNEYFALVDEMAKIDSIKTKDYIFEWGLHYYKFAKDEGMKEGFNLYIPSYTFDKVDETFDTFGDMYVFARKYVFKCEEQVKRCIAEEGKTP